MKKPDKPDTLLTAAKFLAMAAGKEWSDVQPYYRALQTPPHIDAEGRLVNSWLPKSSGRAIWYAHPNFISRLLIALVGTTIPTGAVEAVEWTRALTENGRRMRLDEKPAANVVPPIEREFYRYLADPTAADDLVDVEFYPDRRQIVFNTKTEGRRVFRPSSSYDEYVAPSGGVQRIFHRAVVDGEVFREIARGVKWRMTNNPPMVHASDPKLLREQFEEEEGEVF